MKPDDQSEKTVLMPPILRGIFQDVLTFATLFALIVWPVLNLAVFKPQEDLARRIERIESFNQKTTESLNSIDKNTAVLAESMKGIREQIKGNP